MNLIMSQKPISIAELRTLINNGDAHDPLVFLESVMSGQDPRRISSIYEMIQDINDFTDGNISQGDWSEIVDHVTSNYKYHTVTMTESMNATKTLAEYIHPKRKQVEITGIGDGAASVNGNPLTEEEIVLFKEVFNDEF